MTVMRLDRFLAMIPVGTRSQVKDMIRKGRVSVNAVTAKRPEQKIDTLSDIVAVDRNPVTLDDKVYYMLNKPAGVITATMDKKKKTVLDLLEDKRRDLFPVGRLDIDTEGLLIITNDGGLCHDLLAPKKHIDKTYYVETDSEIPEDAAETFLKGVDLGDFTSMPAVFKALSENTGFITIQEGKFHQVKRMFEAVGTQVVFLKRTAMGSLKLDDSLKPGESRALTEEELKLLKGHENERNCNETAD